MRSQSILSLCVLPITVIAATCTGSPSKAPTVDLGYAVHQVSFDSTNSLYEFKNIRYAEPPLKTRRFRHPVAPVTVNRTVNDASYGFACKQGLPRAKVVELSLPGEDVIAARDRLIQNPLWSEDCLFLNVVVPKAVFPSQQCTGRKARATNKAPVIVWIHGGGSSWGSKDDKEFTPSGLIERSKTNKSDGVIFVAINYRLGLFGFLNSHGDNRIDANAGLLDQRQAIEWVRKHIHLFGGDPDNITVHGQSAGAASIMYHITSPKGVNFKNAILQSPTAPSLKVEDTWTDSLKLASNITGKTIANGEDLAQLSEKELAEVNGLATFNGPGLFYWGPSPDGAYVPDWPNNRLRDGKFNKNPSFSLIAGHTANESIANIPNLPVAIDIALTTLLQPITNTTTKSYILETLYPPPEKIDIYSTAYERVLLLSAEATGFNCNPQLLSTLFKTWNYRFDVPPGYHFQDLNHTFYDGNKQGPVSPPAAIAMQTYFGQFATTANPNTNGNELLGWPKADSERRMMRFVPTGVELGKEVDNAKRCLFWDDLRRGKFEN
ncbi:Alpha/Beta hydrolase protein [Fusarium avenaceum]|nr:Alpha/Beta hydrolase protein [Fusarium avenaceum]